MENLKAAQTVKLKESGENPLSPSYKESGAKPYKSILIKNI
jgi:hypothetical protein